MYVYVYITCSKQSNIIQICVCVYIYIYMSSVERERVWRVSRPFSGFSIVADCAFKVFRALEVEAREYRDWCLFLTSLG